MKQLFRWESLLVISISVPYTNLEQGPFSVLYTALKEMYPGSEDC